MSKGITKLISKKKEKYGRPKYVLKRKFEIPIGKSNISDSNI